MMSSMRSRTPWDPSLQGASLCRQHLGVVDDCVRLLKEYQAAGAAHIVLDPVTPRCFEEG